MSLQKIEIVCPVCPKCDRAEKSIKYALRTLGINVPITRTSDLNKILKTSVNIKQAPVILINDKVEFAGVVPEIPLLKIKLKEFMMN